MVLLDGAGCLVVVAAALSVLLEGASAGVGVEAASLAKTVLAGTDVDALLLSRSTRLPCTALADALPRCTPPLVVAAVAFCGQWLYAHLSAFVCWQKLVPAVSQCSPRTWHAKKRAASSMPRSWPAQGKLQSAPSGVAAFMSAHSKTPYITPSMKFSSGKGVERGRREQQLEFSLLQSHRHKGR